MDGKVSGGRLRWMLAALICLLGWSVPGVAQEQAADNETEDLMGLSLVELLGLEVTTFSRKPQLLSDTPAAMFVVTQNDIATSGARSIPDLLRMVPGLQVAQADSNRWAVTARGSNGVFANKLRVLQDGRRLYNPLYSGVYWDTNDTDLAAIERIEVIRGPGATMWGNNAVNGVINIITKNTADTQGGRINAVAGTERTEGTLSYGGEVGNATYRAFTKYFDRDGYIASDSGDAPDDWDMLRGGVRVDWGYSDDSKVSFISEIYAGDIGQSVIEPTLTAPFSSTTQVDQDVSGAFAQVAWDRRISDTSAVKLQAYYDHTEIDDLAPQETRDTFDIDLQHQFALGGRNDIVWGLGFRHSKDDTEGDFVISLDPDSRTQRLYTAFLQDEISLIDEKLFLLVGTKVSKNSFSNNNLEWEPNVRLSWKVADNHMLWSSVSRAVRIPSRAEQNGEIHAVTVPNPPGVPFVVTIRGDSDLDTEEVSALELGYRGQLADGVNADLSLFFNRYKSLRLATEYGLTECTPSGAPAFPPAFTCPPGTQYITAPILMTNNPDDIDSYGVEFNLSWQALDSLYLQASYSYLNIDDSPVPPESVGSDSPEHQVSVRSLWNISARTSLDMWLRYVSELKKQDISAYVTMDARLAWAATDRVELNLVGRNLLEGDHQEFIPEFGAQVAAEIPREAYLEIKFNF